MKTTLRNINVQAITACLPCNILEMNSLASLYGEDQVHSIINTTGTVQVRIADASTTTADLCQRAAEYLMDKEKIDRNEIDGIVFVSQTPDYIMPSTSVCLQNRLGLHNETVCQDIRYGCSGYIYGMLQAALWVSSGLCKKVLLLAGDTNSKIINEHDRSTKMVFGDAGTATLVTEGNNEISFHIQSDGKGEHKIIIPAGGCRMPYSPETNILEWDEDKNGRTKNDMYMDGMAVFNFAVTKVHKNVNELLEYIDWEKSEVGLYGLHQANKFMVNYISKKMKVGQELVPVNVENYGNTGPASIPLLYSDILSGNHAYNLQKTVSCGFGVGYSWGSFSTNLSCTKFYSPINKD